MATRRRKVLAVFNPVTGRHTTEAIIAPLQEQAAAQAVDLHVELTLYPGHATEIAASAGSDISIVIAIGGDGTVSDVVDGVEGSGIPVGIIPAGSTNVIAKEIGIPRDVREASRIALGDGDLISIDHARIAGKSLLHMAGAGYDAAIMRDTSRRFKRWLGWVAYLPPAIRHINYPLFPVVVTVDDDVHRMDARLVLCAIGGTIIAPRFKVGEGIDRTDGLMDVCVYSPPTLRASLSTIAWIAAGRPGQSRWLTQYRGQRVRLDSDRPVPIEIDGDYRGELPVEIEMLASPVKIFAPSGVTQRLRT